MHIQTLILSAAALGGVAAPLGTLAPVWSSSLSSSASLMSGGLLNSSGVEYVCRYLIDRAGGVALAGRSAGAGTPCLVGINDTEVSAPASKSELLPADPRLGWGAGVPASGSPVVAGDYGGRTRYACRGTTLQGTPHAGSSDLRVYPSGYRCLYSFGGAQLVATGVNVAVLVLMGSEAEVASAGLTPAVPASASPSPTPSQSSSMSPSALFVPWLPTWVAASTLGKPPAALRAGLEGTSIIYVCKGVLSDGSTLPGKYETGWGGCDIPLNEIEVSDPSFMLLRNSSWLHWALAVQEPGAAKPIEWAPPAAGWLPVSGGVHPITRRNRTVCRAYHPQAWSGPHAGYTDGEQLASGGGSDPTLVACQFSWGGLVVHSSTFDILYSGPPFLSLAAAEAANFSVAAKPVASPSRTPSNSRTPSQTPSVSPTPLTTPSPTPSPLPPTAIVWVQVGSSLVADAPTRYVQSAKTTFFACRGVMMTMTTIANDSSASSWSYYAGAYNSQLSSCAFLSGGVPVSPGNRAS